MIRVGSVSIKSNYFVVVCTSLISGTVIGAQLLKSIPVQIVETGMSGMLVIVGTIFIFNINRGHLNRLLKTPPKNPSILDIIMGFLSGLTTGLIGISLPILLFYFGSYLSKDALRHLIILLFIPSAFVQVITFGVNGLLSQEILINSIIAMPILFVGAYVGNHVFKHLSEHRFRQFLGLFLYVIAAKLIFL